MPSLFGTDGIRGSFGKYPITEQFFTRFAHILEIFLCSEYRERSTFTIAIGHDTRESGKLLRDALIHGFSSDVRILDCGVLPTPGVSVVVSAQRCDLGLAITASHNPYTDNGLKTFNSAGEKLPIEAEQQIEKIFAEQIDENIKNDTHARAHVENFREQARDIFINRFDKGADFLITRSVILDTANGAAIYTSPNILEKYCSDLHVIGNQPDGRNINLNCGTEHIDRLQTEVKNTHACLGIAHDGDGDRLIMVDEHAQCLNGDQIIGILANYLKEQNSLPNNTVVVTKQSNHGLDESLKQSGIHIVRTDIGDRNVYYEMLRHGSILGGEESGHIILREHASTGDAVSAAVLLLKIVFETGASLSQLASKIHLFPKKMINLSVDSKPPIEKFSSLAQLLNELEHDNCGYKHSLIRYSGTENKLRILVEADTVHNANNIIQRIRDCVIKEFEKQKNFVK